MKRVSRTGVYGVALKNGKLLLVKQHKGLHSGKWDLPGGGIEVGETIENALRREFQEEVAMSFDTMQLFENFTATIDGVDEQGTPYLFYQIGLIYLVEGISSESNSAELEYAWIDPKELKADEMTPFVRQTLAKNHKSDCLFCQFARLEKEVKFYETFDHCYAIKDQYPVSKGHVLIIPKEHTENWFTAREEVRLDMMKALHLLKDRLDLEYQPDGYNIGANCGESAGQTVMHLHLHLIPRYRGDMEDPRGGVRGVIPSKQKY